jgi:hypothetical protein
MIACPTASFQHLLKLRVVRIDAGGVISGTAPESLRPGLDRALTEEDSTGHQVATTETRRSD